MKDSIKAKMIPKIKKFRTTLRIGYRSFDSVILDPSLPSPMDTHPHHCLADIRL
jgi:hypothetical protein